MTKRSMDFDPKVPSRLKKNQQWFGSIIGRAIDENSCINPIAPSGNPITQEAPLYIAPSPTLQPHQRIELYNQQYWWRLLSTLHDIFPLVVRLFGYYDFNRTLGMPYLEKYPPNHWLLSYLGDSFPQWIAEEYKASDQQLVLHAAQIDLAYNNAFTAASLPPLEQDSLSLADDFNQNTTLTLQPSIYLFALPYDLLSFRKQMVKKSVEHWVENDFPEVQHSQDLFFVVFRGKDHNIAYEKISKGEYQLLRLFQKGSTIEKACDSLEASQELYQELGFWFQKWAFRQWFTEHYHDVNRFKN